MSVPLLQLEDLAVDYRAEHRWVRAVDGVTASVQRGECVAFLGERRVGKSAIAATVAGAVAGARATGRVVFEGRDLRSLAPRAQREMRGRRIALLITELEHALDPRRRVLDHFAEALRAHRTLAPEQIERRAHAALERIGVEAPEFRLRAHPTMLAPAERARIAAALALVHGPDLVIADEPGRELDEGVQRSLMADLAAHCRARGAGLVWMTRDVEAVEDLADRVAVLHAGRIVEEGPARAALQRPAHPYTRGLVDTIPLRVSAGARLRPPPVKPRLPSLATACAFRDRCGWAMHACLAAPGLQVVGPAPHGRAVRCHHPLPVGGRP